MEVKRQTTTLRLANKKSNNNSETGKGTDINSEVGCKRKTTYNYEVGYERKTTTIRSGIREIDNNSEVRVGIDINSDVGCKKGQQL